MRPTLSVALTMLLLLALAAAAQAKDAPRTEPGASALNTPRAPEPDGPAMGNGPPLAVPDAAVLYPRSGSVSGRLDLPADALRDGRAAFLLPIQADPQTLRVAPVDDTLRLGDVSWDKADLPEPERVRALRERLVELRNRLEVARVKLSALQTRADYWQSQTGFDAPSAEEMAKADETMAERLDELLWSRHTRQQEIEDLDRQIQEAEQELDRIGAHAGRAWLVRVAAEPAREGTNATTALEWSCTMSDCGWDPFYRLEALPDDNRVEFAFQARVRQSTGMDWNNTRLSLATLQPRQALQPPPLPDWIIRPQPERPEPAAKAMRMEAQVAAMPEAAGDAQAPRETRMTTYAVWELGSRSLPAGEEPRLDVVRETWDAEFLYTARPAVDPRAFLTARASLETPRELPPGRALFLADGALLGRRQFGHDGAEEAELFFGPDPLLSITMDLTARMAGDQGLIGKRQTQSWTWTLTAENRKKYAVTLRLEEPRPQARHEDIKIETASEPATGPAAQGEEDVLHWTLELAPGQTRRVAHTVRVTAPADMDIDLGWR